jgi:hypothetical protein
VMTAVVYVLRSPGVWDLWNSQVTWSSQGLTLFLSVTQGATAGSLVNSPPKTLTSWSPHYPMETVSLPTPPEQPQPCLWHNSMSLDIDSGVIWPGFQSQLYHLLGSFIYPSKPQCLHLCNGNRKTYLAASRG